MPEHDTKNAPLMVYLLADHLDAVLAAGEDIVTRGHELQVVFDAKHSTAEHAIRLRTVVEGIRALELMLVVRAMKARDHALDLADADPRFRMVANLFASGTAILLDAVAECGDSRNNDFDTGDEVVAYLRSRGLIAAGAAGLSTESALILDDTFLTAKRIALGPLLEMAASFLDALEVHYELFASDNGTDVEADPKDHDKNAASGGGLSTRLAALSIN